MTDLTDRARRLVAWDRPGPRYTSYPTVPVWGAIDDSVVAGALANLGQPAQVYAHIPFCAEQCTFCGCNMVVAGRRVIGARYLAALDDRVRALPLPAPTVAVQRIHLGGGTPTWLDPDELQELHRILVRRFVPIEGAELSIECDPQITTIEQLDTLHALGFRRASFGVQSFDPKVLDAVNRPQLAERVVALVRHVRELGWRGTNLDLMYGLPEQDVDSLDRTLAAAIELGAERLSVFGFAHVPWLKRHQRAIDADALPSPEMRAEMALLAQDRLHAAGYERLGLDHFAAGDDDLAVAARERRLHRNFMGYTTLPDVDLIGVGMSAISEVQGVFWQEESHLGRWIKAVQTGQGLYERGRACTAEDRLRAHVVSAVMCNLEIRDDELRERFGVGLWEHFPDARSRLSDLEDAGFVELDEHGLRVTEAGRPLLRLPAMVFDAYLPSKAPAASAEPRFSRAI